MLQELVPDQIWHAQQRLRMGPIEVTTRMTVIRLADGSLWVHSPIEPTAALVTQLCALGDVHHVVAPNRSHHLFFLPFMRAFPDARGFIAPGLAEKLPALAAYPCLTTVPSPNDGLLPSWFIEGLPLLNETVWFHEPSGTLVLTDLLFCFGSRSGWLAPTLAKTLGVYERVAMSRTMKLAVRDRQAMARSVAPLLELPVQRIILAHDQVIDAAARDHLRNAFAWLYR